MRKNTWIYIGIFSVLSILISESNTAPVEAQVTSTAQINTSAGITAVIPAGFSFSQNLKTGDTISPDVSYLQVVLNSDPRTKVADTGPGSPTQLTNFFGTLTKDAVMRFQNIYKDEILAPAGLSSATGMVGPMTRIKLNTLLGNTHSMQNAIGSQIGTFVTNTIGANSSQTGTPRISAIKEASGVIIAGPGTKPINASELYTATTSIGMRIYALPEKALSPKPKTPPRFDALQISGLSTYQTRPNVVMSIFGAGFTDSNNVFLGPVRIGSYPTNTSGTQITFPVPDYLPRGFYQVGVSNTYGTSTISEYTYLILDTASSSQKTIPTINEITPAQSSNINDVLLIGGQNFTTDNTIKTNLGDIKHLVSADGRTITFLAGALPYYSDAQSDYKGKSINVNIKVVNENGESTDSITHVITFPNSNTPSVNYSPQTTTLAAQINNQLIGASGTSTNLFGTTGIHQKATTTTNKTGTTNTNTNNSTIGPTYHSTTAYSPYTTNNTSNNSSGSSNNSSNDSNNNSSSLLNALGGAVAGALGGSGSSGGSSSGGGMVDYFGGTITQSIYCSCNSTGDTMITVDDYATGQSVTMFYTPGQSRLNMNYNVWSVGAYVIGGFNNGGGECEVYAGEDCVSEGTANYTIDSIRGIGTSSY